MTCSICGELHLLSGMEIVEWETDESVPESETEPLVALCGICRRLGLVGAAERLIERTRRLEARLGILVSMEDPAAAELREFWLAQARILQETARLARLFGDEGIGR
jgi:hypothetical protein